MLLFGTLEEIAARKVAERPTARAGVPEGQTVAGTVPGDNLGFDLNVVATPSSPADFVWGQSESEMPPLPQKLAPSQAARLAEIFDFLHRGLSFASENIDANDDGTLIRVGYVEWQTIQTVQLFLARYTRAVADPEHQAD